MLNGQQHHKGGTMLKAPVPVAMAATETKVGVIHPRLLLAHLSGCNMEASQEPIPSGLQKQELLSLSLGASHLSKWKCNSMLIRKPALARDPAPWRILVMKEFQ